MPPKAELLGCMDACAWMVSTYMYIDIIFLFVCTFHLERMIGVGVNSRYLAYIHGRFVVVG